MVPVVDWWCEEEGVVKWSRERWWWRTGEGHDGGGREGGGGGGRHEEWSVEERKESGELLGGRRKGMVVEKAMMAVVWSGRAGLCRRRLCIALLSHNFLFFYYSPFSPLRQWKLRLFRCAHA